MWGVVRAVIASPSCCSQPLPPSRGANDVARFLAGLPGTPGSPFADLEKTETWQAHRKYLDDAWSKAEGSLLSELTGFRNQEMAQEEWTSPVFYPFGGPDALTVTQLFPRTDALREIESRSSECSPPIRGSDSQFQSA